jgi:PadR family transcriptional regulator, regulatory protein PadR
MTSMNARMPDNESKRGGVERLVLSLVEARPRHGYEITKLIEARSAPGPRLRVASLYTLLYRLEKRGWIAGRWVEKAGQRRRYYHLTPEGEKALATRESVAPAAAACVLGLTLAVSNASAQSSRADSANSYIERGSSWLKKGEFERAISDFSLAIATDQQIATAWYGREPPPGTIAAGCGCSRAI